jgi:nucleoside phosphorylase
VLLVNPCGKRDTFTPETVLAEADVHPVAGSLGSSVLFPSFNVKPAINVGIAGLVDSLV